MLARFQRVLSRLPGVVQIGIGLGIVIVFIGALIYISTLHPMPWLRPFLRAFYVMVVVQMFQMLPVTKGKMKHIGDMIDKWFLTYQFPKWMKVRYCFLFALLPYMLAFVCLLIWAGVGLLLRHFSISIKWLLKLNPTVIYNNPISDFISDIMFVAGAVILSVKIYKWWLSKRVKTITKNQNRKLKLYVALVGFFLVEEAIVSGSMFFIDKFHK